MSRRNKIVKKVSKPKTVKKIVNRKERIHIVVDDDNEFWLDSESIVTYYPNLLSKKFQETLYQELEDTVPWVQGVYQMFGKPVKTPRMLWCMKDNDLDISKVYKVTGSMPWTKQMLKLKKMVEKKTGKKIGYAQLNFYRDGDDYIGYHTDSEIQDGDIIASVSLGETRKFTFRSIDYKKDKLPIYEIDLEPGSLIIMDERAGKKNWKHCLPKMPKVESGRINITFRPK